MTSRRTLLLAGCALACLLVVAGALPAADPRIELPGAGDGPGSSSGSGLGDSPGGTTGLGDSPGGTTGPGESGWIRITDPLVPGTEAGLELGTDGPGSGVPIQFGGERVDITNESGYASFPVPYRERVTVTTAGMSSDPAAGISRTVDVRTDAQIRSETVVPDREFTITATVGETPVPDAAVYQDGEQVATTDATGSATVESREEPGETRVAVERGAVTSEQTIEVPELSVALDAQFPFPGSFASVTVTADGEPVADAQVLLDGDEAATTDADGTASIRLPLSNQATVTAEVGSATRTASIGNLYLNLTAAVVLVPGLILGTLWAFGRVLSLLNIGTGGSRDSTSLFVTLGSAMAALAALLSVLAGALSRLARFTPFAAGHGVSLRGIPARLRGLFAGSGSDGGFTWPSMPSIGLGLSLPTLSFLSLDRFRPVLSASSAPDERPRSDAVASEPGAEILDGRREPSGDRSEIRAIWGAFLDDLHLDERETRTAGEVARHALALGYPTQSVGLLVATFREVEYGDRDPSIERVTTARAAYLDLEDNTPGGERE